MKVKALYIVCIAMFFMIISCKNEQSKQKTVPVQAKLVLPANTSVDVLIDKSDYKLSIYAADTLVKEYDVVFGGNPVDDKHKEGDKCTPEGVFGMRDKYPHKSWSKFIWIDYPNEDSWRKFNKRKAEGIIKDGESIGGEVGIHGVPDGMDHVIDNKQNWTLGCISMRNNDVNEIYPYITKQTKITIQK